MTTDIITNEEERKRFIADAEAMPLPFTGSLKMGTDLFYLAEKLIKEDENDTPVS